VRLSVGEKGRARARGRRRAQLHLNLFWGVMDGSIFGVYLVLADVNLVIPWMLSQMTESRTIIGLAPTIVLVGSALPQLSRRGWSRPIPTASGGCCASLSSGC
jgi:hypothetical protein